MTLQPQMDEEMVLREPATLLAFLVYIYLAPRSPTFQGERTHLTTDHKNNNHTTMKTTIITTTVLALASPGISAAAHRGSLGHHQPQANVSDKATPLIPPINGHKNYTRPAGVYVSWPTDYTYRPPIWKIPPTAFPNPTRELVATMTATDSTFRVVTTSTVSETSSTPFNPRAGTP